MSSSARTDATSLLLSRRMATLTKETSTTAMRPLGISRQSLSLRLAGVAVRAVPQQDVVLIALRGKAQSAIKELVQQAQQFHLAINFDRATRDTLALQEFPEMSLGESNGPAEV